MVNEAPMPPAGKIDITSYTPQVSPNTIRKPVQPYVELGTFEKKVLDTIFFIPPQPIETPQSSSDQSSSSSNSSSNSSSTDNTQNGPEYVAPQEIYIELTPDKGNAFIIKDPLVLSTMAIEAYGVTMDGQLVTLGPTKTLPVSTYMELSSTSVFNSIGLSYALSMFDPVPYLLSKYYYLPSPNNIPTLGRMINAGEILSPPILFNSLSGFNEDKRPLLLITVSGIIGKVGQAGPFAKIIIKTIPSKTLPLPGDTPLAVGISIAMEVEEILVPGAVDVTVEAKPDTVYPTYYYYYGGAE